MARGRGREAIHREVLPSISVLSALWIVVGMHPTVFRILEACVERTIRLQDTCTLVELTGQPQLRLLSAASSSSQLIHNVLLGAFTPAGERLLLHSSLPVRVHSGCPRNDQPLDPMHPPQNIVICQLDRDRMANMLDTVSLCCAS